MNKKNRGLIGWTVVTRMLVVGMVTLTKRRRERWSHKKTQIQIQNKKEDC